MVNWNGQPPSISVLAKPSDRRCPGYTFPVARWLGVILLIMFPQGSVCLTAQVETLDQILAVVDGQVIMHSDVRAFIDLGLVDRVAGPQQEAEVLTYLIERLVILDQVDRFEVTEPPQEAIDQQLDDVRGRLSDGVNLTLVLDKVGLTPDDLSQLVTDDLRRDAYLADRFDIVVEARREQAMSEWVADLIDRAQVTRLSQIKGPEALKE